MKTYKLLAIIAIMAITCASPVFAQNELSPYSQFGYGSLSDFTTSTQRSMGGIGYAMNNGRQINVKNPASYANCDSLTFLFDFGLDFTNLKSKEGTTEGHSFGGGLDYITMQFPLSKKVGGSIGLVPYSSVGYSFGSEMDNGIDSRSGSGGINMLYAGIAYRPFNGFSIGANISYNFGTIVNDTYITATEVSSQTLFERVMQIRDWSITLGAQYTLNINEKNSVTVGVVYSPSKTFLGNTWGAKYDVANDNTTEIDTIGYTSMKDGYTAPTTIGGGISYNFNKRFMVEADFTYQNWKDAKFSEMENFETTTFDNRWKVAAGMSYTPNPRGNYLQRINYRLGGHFNHDYITVRGNNVKDYGIAVGFGLPTPSTKTIINIGVEYKHRAAYPDNLISENYINFTIGINFNEMWFWQDKIR